MSLRIDAAADSLTRTTGVPATLTNATWTMMAWVYFVALPAASGYHSLFGFNQNANVRYDMLYINNNAGTTNLNIQSDNGSYSEVRGSASLSVSTWYHIALARSSNTALIGYVNGASDGTNTQSQSASTGTNRIELGAFAFWGDTCSARFAGFKWYDAALTAAEIAQEMQTIRPWRFTSLNTFAPMLPGSGERAADYSGNGRNFTENGTLTDEDPPPVSWGASVIALIENPSGGVAPQDTPELYGRPYGVHGQFHMQQVLAQ